MFLNYIKKGLCFRGLFFMDYGQNLIKNGISNANFYLCKATQRGPLIIGDHYFTK